ncbi:non-ribosomal peptide synthetase [Chitinophaga nivalis]|uniref:Amino acid adenylation domain-containing protein n=1 Tax=Chitinophaga nivalis TaxID=2991709 RepID=A0ABT3IIT2_9BACT|nr:non-ribosomal peptide synthetase [Chitinophaga nivalis]MCW3466424.1 amino acid adenylation domain-containing protein [Chitinophaga nivalis]MCW3483885.1 amino acid adenylation domain-containing protein [Chitinophaga nivalis]
MNKEEILIAYKSGKLSKEETIIRLLQEKQPAVQMQLSENQKGMWAFQQMNPLSFAYNIPVCIHITADMDATRFTAAYKQVLQRFPVLRSRFKNTGDAICRFETPVATTGVQVEAAAGWSDDAVMTWLEKQVRKPFQLEHDTLVRMVVVSRSATDHYVLFVIHHIIFDGNSIAPLLDAFLQACQGYRNDAASPVNCLYDNYVKAEQDFLRDAAAPLAYWQQQLQGPLPVLPFSTNHHNIYEAPDTADIIHLSLEAPLSQQIKKVAREQQLSVAAILLGVFKLLLYRYTKEEDIIVGMPATIKPSEAFDDQVGLFVNMIPVRSSGLGSITFRELVQHIMSAIADGLDNAAYPFSLLVKKLAIPADGTQAPVFQVAYAYQDFMSEVTKVLQQYEQQLPAKWIDRLYQSGEYELGLEVMVFPEYFELKCKYQADRYTSFFVTQFMQHYKQLLEAVTADPVLPLSAYPVLSGAEKQQLEDMLASPVREAVHGKSLPALIEDFAATRPLSIAIKYGQQEYSYAALNTAVNQLTHYLRENGLQPQQFAGVFLDRSPAAIISMLAIMKAGAVYVPLDPAYPQDRLEYMMQDAAVGMVITTEALAKRLPDTGAALLLTDVMATAISRMPDTTPGLLHTLTDRAYVIYTSGSTGKPKGVVVAHKGIPNLIRSQDHLFAVGHDSTVLQFASCCFDASVWEVCMGLGTGSTLLVADKQQLLPGETLFNLLSQYQVTHVTLPPSVLAALPLRALPALHTIIVAGEACPDKIVREWGTGRKFFNAYGPTEYTVCATVSAPLESDQKADIGRAIFNTRCFILDEHLQQVPIGVPGELHIAGHGLAIEYLNRPELNESKFISLLTTAGVQERVYKTGDLVCLLPNGNITFLGRIDTQVKIRGHRIELEEIENCVSTFKGIENCAVVVYGAQQQLIAYYTVTGDWQHTADATSLLRHHLLSLLPEYMVPFIFTLLDRMPLTNSGKIDRKLLAEKPLTSPKAPASGLSMSATEVKVAAIWNNVLQTTADNIQEGFFTAGGNSITAVLLAEKISKEFDCAFPVTHLFRFSNIQEISRYVLKSAPEKVIQTSAQESHTVQPTAPVNKPAPDITYPDDSIAIVGISCRFPGATHKEIFWENLVSGKEGLKWLSPEELQQRGFTEQAAMQENLVAVQGTIEEKSGFDPAFFNISPKDAEMMDPQLRHLLMHAWHAIEDAGYRAGEVTDTGVFMTASNNMYQAMLPGTVTTGTKVIADADEYVGLMMAQGGTIPTMISFKLNLKGPSLYVHANCSSSLVALHLACQSLKNGETRQALVGGATLFAADMAGYVYQPGLNFSSDGHCKTFDAAADGMVPAEGVGVMFLKRMKDAVNDGDHVYAVIRGIAVNNDGGDKTGFYAPGINGQAAVIQAVHTATGINPDNISYVEAHGTGTRLGDPIELAALSEIYERYTDRKQYCGIGAVKTNLGHLDTAAGIAGSIKLALGLSHGFIPPSINFKKANPAIDFAASPFYVADRIIPLPRRDTPYHMSLSAFGLGGTNAHAIFESYHPVITEDTIHPAAAGTFIVPLSAKNKERLHSYAARLQAFLLKDAAAAGLTATQLTQDIRAIIADLTGIAIAQINTDQSLSELNLDAFQTSSLLHRLAGKYGCTFEQHYHPATVEELVSGILQRLKVSGDSHPALQLTDIAYTMQVGRETMHARVAFVVKDILELQTQLEDYLAGKEQTTIFTGEGKPARQAQFFVEDEAELESMIEKWLAAGKAGKVAALWAAGFSVNWTLLYPHSRPRRVSLPGYPFAMDHYWLPEKAVERIPKEKVVAATNTIAPPTSPELLLFREVWTPAPASPVAHKAVRLLCFMEDAAIQKDFSLALSAAAAGSEVIFVSTGTAYRQVSPHQYVIRRQHKADYRQLMGDIAVTGSPDGIVYNWKDGADYTALVYLIQVLDDLSASSRLLLIADPADVYQAAWTGFERSLGQVAAAIQLTVLYETSGIPDAGHVLAGLSATKGVRYIAGTRHVQQMQPVERSAGTAFKTGGTYLITGGFGGLGKMLAHYLVSRYQAKLILLGRTPANDGQTDFMATLEALGGQVHYLAADVTDREVMTDRLATARTLLGALNGVLHVAGAAGNGSILETTIDAFHDTVAAKVQGTVILDELLAGEALDFVCYYSSAAAILGDFGSCDYAAANRFQMAYAEYRNQLVTAGLRYGKTMAINWPAWREGGMGAGATERAEMYLRSSGQAFLEKAEGMALLEQLLTGTHAHVLVMKGYRERIYQFLHCSSAAEASQPVIPEVSSTAHRVAAGSSVRMQLEKELRELAAGVLKQSPDKLDPAENLVDMGYDSVSLTGLAAAYRAHFDINVTPALFFDYTNLHKLTAYFLQEHEEKITAFYRQEQPVVTPVAVAAPRIQEQPAMPVLSAANITGDEAIAIIGMSGRFPQARNVQEMWQILADNRNVVEAIPADRFNWSGIGAAEKDKERWCGCVPGVKEFDPLFFEISPREAEIMDPRQRLLLQESWKALEDAGYGPVQLNAATVGVFVGVEQGDYQDLVKDSPFITANHDGILAARLSYFLDLKGPVLAINTACSSGLVALHQACQSLRSKECDTAIAAGVNLILTPMSHVGMGQAGMLSGDGKCAVFDKSADGIVPGEAVVAVVLKRLAHAVRDGDPIHGVIRGSGTNYDGKTNGITAPGGLAQAGLLRGIYDRFAINPADITYVVTHGTGTRLGDPIEVNALNTVFKKYTDQLSYCALTSAKTNFGHTLAASGLLNVVNVIQAMKHQLIPASLHFREPNEFITWENSPFYVNDRNRSWQPAAGKPLTGAVSAFGMSGTNAHAVLESYTAASPQDTIPHPYYLLPLSAKSSAALQERMRDMIVFLEQTTTCTLAALSYTLQQGRHHFNHRVVILVADKAAAIQAWKDILAGREVKDTFQGVTNWDTLPDGQPVTDLLSEAGQVVQQPAHYREVLAKLAACYCEGHVLDWAALYGEVKPARIHLPTYPFTRNTYWLPETAAPAAPLPVAQPLNTLLPHRTAANSFHLELAADNDTGLYEKTANGKQYVRGLVYLEIVRQAAIQLPSAAAGILRITDVRWSQPLTLQAVALRLHITFFTAKERWAFEVKEDTTQSVLCQGYLQPIAPPATAGVPVSAIKAHWPLHPPVTGSVITGPVYIQGQEYLIGLPATGKDWSRLASGLADTDLSSYLLQTVAVLLQEHLSGPMVIPPVTLSSLEIYQPAGIPAFALIKYDGSGSVLRLNIKICNEAGTVLLQWKDFAVKVPVAGKTVLKPLLSNTN